MTPADPIGLATWLTLLSLDGFVVCLGLGILGLGGSREKRLAGVFGLADGWALFVGAVAGTVISVSATASADRLSPVLLGAYAAYVVLLALRGRSIDLRGRGGVVLYALPVLLCVDNLIAGAYLRAAAIDPLLVAVAAGLTSCTLAWLGLRLGALATRWGAIRPSWAGYIAGLVLFADASRLLATR